ncbi:MAG TPA: undecaprenyl diphosphate synthase family protein, partial [Elusimicrobiales bacterium]|nr:undecaprenyl diphosphate synthase family protein [Elusimicrobiales bacterium]
ITEKDINDNLYTHPLPDPDLIIRTSGEMRISNFLIWQSAYSEFFVTSKYWPDFDEKDLFEAVINYSKRERRMGR